MATKAELEAELAELKREMKKREEEAGSGRSEITAADDDVQTAGADGLQGLLDDLGIKADTFETFRENLLGEVTALQKEKPLVALVAAVALGVIIGRAFK